MSRPRSSMLSQHLLKSTQPASETEMQDNLSASPTPPPIKGNSKIISAKDRFKPQVKDPARPWDVTIISRTQPGTLPENRKKGTAYTFIVPKQPEQKADASGKPISKAKAAQLKRKREMLSDSEGEGVARKGGPVGGSKKRKQTTKTSRRGEADLASTMTEAEEDAALDEDERSLQPPKKKAKAIDGGVKVKLNGVAKGLGEKAMARKEADKTKAVEAKPQESNQSSSGRDNRYGGAGREGRFKLT